MAAFSRENGYVMCTHMFEQGMFALLHLRDLIISTEVQNSRVPRNSRDGRVLRDRCNEIYHRAIRTWVHMHDFNLLVLQSSESEIAEREKTIQTLGFRLHQLLSCPAQPVGNVIHENEIETALIGVQNQVDLLSSLLETTLTRQAVFQGRFDAMSCENTTMIRQRSAENSTLRSSSSFPHPAVLVFDENKIGPSLDALLPQLDILFTSLEATSTGQVRVQNALDAMRSENAILKKEIETLGQMLVNQEQLLKDACELNALQKGDLINQEQELGERTLKLKGAMKESQQNARNSQQNAEQLKHAIGELEEMKKKAISTANSFSKQATENDKQRQEIVRLKDSISNLQIELASAGDESQSQRKELTTLVQKLAVTEEQMSSKQLENSKLTMQVETLEKQLRDSKTWNNPQNTCDLEKLRTQVRILEEAKRVDEEIKLQMTMDRTGMKQLLESRNARIERLDAQVASLISAKIPKDLNVIIADVVNGESNARKVSENMSFFVGQLNCQIAALQALMKTEGDAGKQCATNDLVQKSIADLQQFKKSYTKKRDELETELVGLRIKVMCMTEEKRQMDQTLIEQSKHLYDDLHDLIGQVDGKSKDQKGSKKGGPKRR